MVDATTRGLANEILSKLPEGMIILSGDDSTALEYRVRRSPGWKLRTIVLSKRALHRLLDDPLRSVKVEYIQRDLQRSASVKREFRYPYSFRPSRRRTYESKVCNSFALRNVAP